MFLGQFEKDCTGTGPGNGPPCGVGVLVGQVFNRVEVGGIIGKCDYLRGKTVFYGMGRTAPDFDFVQPAAVRAGAGKPQAQFSGDCAVIGEIDPAIGGDCLQVRP